MSEPLETEVKLVCPAGLSEAEVGVALESMDLTVSWHGPEPQRDTYFDTTDGALLKANASLRLRCIGATAIGTFKLPQSQSGAVLERQEIEWELPPNTAQTWTKGADGFPYIPPDVAAKLQEHGAQSIAPVLTVMTVRRKGYAMGADRLCVEVALDESTFTGRRGEATQHELELELKAGPSSRLRAIAEVLRERLSLRPSEKSKFAAGMERVG